MKSRSAAIERTPEHIYLGFGSNVGDREAILQETICLLKESDCDILRTSNLYNTEPWGGAPGDDYLNAVIELETGTTPQEFLAVTQKIELQLGRTRESKYAPRTCDLDILLWRNNIVDEPALTIPHPRINERRFVLRPLCDLIPDATHPVSRKTFKALLAAVRDDLEVSPFLPQAEKLSHD